MPTSALPPRTPALVALLASSAFGCIGSIGGEDGGSSDDPDGDETAYATSAFECKPGIAPAELPLRRLSNLQYRNVVEDAVRRIVPTSADAVLSEVSSPFNALPRDTRSGPEPKYGGFRRLDQAIFQETVSGAYKVGAEIGKAIVDDPARLTEAAGDCATDADTSNDAACLDAFIQKIAPRTLRRPITEDDVAFYRGVAGETLEKEDYADIITVLLSAPSFLYFVEEGSGEPADGAVTLSPHELANRLAFHFWQSAPDDELWALAESGELASPEVYAAQVERLFADARAQRSLDEFYGEWLDPQHLGQLDSGLGTPDFEAFRGDFTPTGETRQHMVDEVTRMGRFYTVDAPASFDEFFTSDRSFAENEDVASLYGVSVWTGGEPPVLPPEREGVAARALLLSSGSASTHPIMKGVFLRKAVLCDTIPPPPGDAMAVAMELKPAGITARDLAVAVSEARPDCAACHTTLINPLGFVTESFDALGRYRTEETAYDKTTGEVLGTAPVDTSAVPQVTSEDMRPASTVAEVNQYMLESEKPQACFARRYFRFTFGREEGEGDGCILADTHEALLEGGDLGAVMKSMAQSPQFQKKTYTP
ncbi:MAG: DUF1592 domain-containing protein [Myxococcales bacterium]|nr:DUF1592 domain-containing protein [Myxococcales bacterium]